MDRINLKIIHLTLVFVVTISIFSSCKLYEDNEFSTYQGTLNFEDGSPASNIEVLFTNKLLSTDLEGFSWDDVSLGIYRAKTDDKGMFRFVVPKKNFQFALSARDNFDPLYYLYIEPDFVFGVEKNDEIIEEIYLFLNDFSRDEDPLDLSKIFVKPL